MEMKPLSPVLMQASTTDDTSIIHFLLVSHEESLRAYISESTRRALLRDHKVLMISDVDQTPALIRRALAQSKIAHLHGAWSTSAISSEDRERLRLLSTIGPVERPTTDVGRLCQYVDLLTDRLRSIHADTQLPLAHGQTIPELLMAHSEHKMMITDTDRWVDSVGVSPTQELIDNIDELQAMYRARYYQLLHDGIIDSDIYATYESYEQARECIVELYDEVQASYDQFCALKKNILSGIHREVRSEKKRWQQILNQIELIHFTFDEVASHVSRGSAIAKVMQEAHNMKHLRLDEIHCQSYELPAVDELRFAISSLVDNSAQIAESAAEAYWSRLTPFNTKDAKLDEVQAALSRVCQSIARTAYLHVDTQEHALTLSHMEDNLKRILLTLGRCKSVCDDHNYIQFRRLAAEIGVSEELLYLLIDTDGDLSWSQYIQSVFLTRLSRLEDASIGFIRDQLCYAEGEISHWAIDSIHNRLCQARDIVLQDMTSEVQLPIAHLLHQYLDEMSIAELLSLRPDLIMELQPITTIRVDELALLSDDVLRLWDEVVFCDVKSVEEDVVDRFVSAEMKVSIATRHPVQLNDVQRRWMTELYFSHDIPIRDLGHLMGLQRADRYYQARALASAIYSCVKSFDIYRIREKCIISLLSVDMNTHIMETVQSPDLNVLHIQSDRIEDITEAMLMVDTEVYILHPDGNLSSDVSTVPWQRYVISQLEKAGIILIDVQMRDLIKNYPNTMRKITYALSSYEGSNEMKSPHLSVSEEVS